MLSLILRLALKNVRECVHKIKMWKNRRIMRKKYSTDLTDKQWEEIKPLLVGMRNRKWSKRDLIDAVFYLVDSGCKWRQLPHDFPPAFTVHSFYPRAKLSGLWDKILQHIVKVTSLRRSCRFTNRSKFFCK